MSELNKMINKPMNSFKLNIKMIKYKVTNRQSEGQIVVLKRQSWNYICYSSRSHFGLFTRMFSLWWVHLSACRQMLPIWPSEQRMRRWQVINYFSSGSLDLSFYHSLISPLQMVGGGLTVNKRWWMRWWRWWLWWWQLPRRSQWRKKKRWWWWWEWWSKKNDKSDSR